MNGKRNNPAEKSAGSVPARGDGYTVDDVKTALEESQKALHEAVFIARNVWEQDSEALRFDIDDLVQIGYSARTVAGKVPELCARFPLRALIYTVSGLYPELPANQKDK